MRLVDAHAHVQADRFAGDLQAVLDSAVAAGIERLLVPGWDLASSRDAIALAARAGGEPAAATSARAGGETAAPAADAAVASGRPERLPIDAAVGIHPHEAARADPADWDAVCALAAGPIVRAIGETGLDYDRAFSPREVQLANLRRHLALGRETGKPVILHCRSAVGRRDAQDDLIAELRAAGIPDPVWTARLAGRPPAILHSFSGPVDYAEAALELGLAIGFSGLVFRTGEEASAEVVRLVPVGRLLAETDSPYLSPPGAPRRRNEPAWVRITAAWIAERRGDDPDVLGDVLVAAYDATFGPPSRDGADVMRAGR